MGEGREGGGSPGEQHIKMEEAAMKEQRMNMYRMSCNVSA